MTFSESTADSQDKAEVEAEASGVAIGEGGDMDTGALLQLLIEVRYGDVIYVRIELVKIKLINNIKFYFS